MGLAPSRYIELGNVVPGGMTGRICQFRVQPLGGGAGAPGREPPVVGGSPDCVGVACDVYGVDEFAVKVRAVEIVVQLHTIIGWFYSKPVETKVQDEGILTPLLGMGKQGRQQERAQQKGMARG
jgi:hypothetical protein